MTTGIVTIDLDSTLADTTHRAGMIDRVVRENTDWLAYSMACANDSVIEATVRLVHLLAASFEIHCVTGRDGRSRGLTMTWLRQQGLPVDALWMDEDGATGGLRESQAAFKLRKLREIQERTGKQVLLHVDDWADIKVLLEANGFPCICVRTPSEVADLTAVKA